MTSNGTHPSFKLLRQSDVPLLQATFYESEHIATGAQHIHFACDERHNHFGSIIPAVPADETGAPHILEHMVLMGGSKQYPDARSLGSLRLSGGGAWTNWEYTWYTFGGRYKEDFLKRIDSQLAFLFEPLLGEETFWHQAHHLEFEDPEDPSTPLRIRGVIFNEQKGIFSMPLYVTWTEIARALFPGMPYALEHGGTARTTPELTWEQLKDFHSKHYHPANSYFISWGDIAVGQIQEAIDKALTRVPERPIERTQIPPLVRFKKPVRHNGMIPIAAGEDPRGRGIVVMAWVTADSTDSYEFLLNDIVADVLVGSPSSPLRKALVSSGLGQSVAETFDRLGLRYRDMTFSAGLEGVDIENADKVEAVIMETLKRVVKEGIPQLGVDAAINLQEFRRRLLQSARGNEGSPSSLFIEYINTPWVNGGDPLRQVNIEEDLQRLERERETGRPVEDRIQKWLIDNPHRALVVLEADPGADVRMEDAERRKLEELKAKLSDDEKQEIIEKTRRLRAYQEERSKLPETSKEDKDTVPEAPPKLEPIESQLAGVSVEAFPVRTNGITYVDLLIDIGDLPDELWDYLRIFSLAVPRAGADGRSSDEMSAFIASSTGGISAEVTVPVDGSGEKHRRFLRFGGSALERRQDELVSSIARLLGAGEFTPELVKGVVGGALAQAEQGVFTQATNFLRLLAGSHVRQSWGKRERLFGFTHLALLRKLGQAGAGLEEVASKLRQIRDHVARRGAFQVFVAASTKEAIDSLEPSLEKALSSLPEGGTQAGFFDDSLLRDDLINEARTFGMPAAFNCEVIATPGLGHANAVPLTVASGLMARHISIEVVRKGTAYHAGCDASTDGGSFANWSVRDPHIARTYRSFEQAITRVLKDPIDATEFNLILRGLSSRAELLEDTLRRARRVFVERHGGLDPNRFSRYGEAIAKVTEEDVRRVVEEHLAGKAGAKATLASADMIESAKKEGIDFHAVSTA